MCVISHRITYSTLMIPLSLRRRLHEDAAVMFGVSLVVTEAEKKNKPNKQKKKGVCVDELPLLRSLHAVFPFDSERALGSKEQRNNNIQLPLR